MSDDNPHPDPTGEEPGPPGPLYPDGAVVRRLAVGGLRHGEVIELPEDAKSWVDLLSAETYLLASYPYIERSPVNPRSRSLMKGFEITVLVHESIWNSPADAQAWFNSLALTRIYREFGREVPADQILKRFAGGQSPNGKAGQG